MLKNKKTILITGGGQGIGQAIAFRFALDGNNLVIASKDDPTQIKETIDGILARGGQALTCEVDVSHAEDLKKRLKQLLAAMVNLIF